MDLQFRIGLGVAVLFGLLPYAVKDMPQWLSWSGIALGVGLVIWALVPTFQRFHGPMLLGVVGIACIAGAAGWYRDISKDTASLSRDAVAHLSALGWSVKPQQDGSIQFEIANGPLPSIEQSVDYFKHLEKPFSLHFQSVTGLAGLHLLADIADCTKIEINAGEFTNISELSGFKHLTTLVISQLPLNGAGTVDVSIVGTMTSLHVLNLNAVRTRDIAALATLKQITSLNLGGTLISDISPLSNFPQLETLEIRDTRVTDLRPLASARALRELVISGTQLPGLAALKHLTSLKKLSIIEQKPIDLSPVSALPELEALWIWCGSAPVDLSALAELKNLRSLTITGGAFVLTPTAHIEVISGMSKLQTLTLGYLQIADISFMSSLTNLTELNLNAVPVTSIAVLASLTSLHKIVFANTSIVDVSPLLGLPALTDLTVGRTPA
jgi:hypothetical protein